MKMLRIVLICAVCCAAAPLFAGDQPADNMEIVREAIQAEKKLFIAENMLLSENEATAFWPIYDDYQESLKKIVDRNIKLIETYAENYEAMTDQVADRLIKEFLNIEKEAVKLRESFLPKFSSVLPATKVARYYQLENKIEAVAKFDMAVEIPVIPVIAPGK